MDMVMHDNPYVLPFVPRKERQIKHAIATRDRLRLTQIRKQLEQARTLGHPSNADHKAVGRYICDTCGGIKTGTAARKRATMQNRHVEQLSQLVETIDTVLACW